MAKDGRSIDHQSLEALRIAAVKLYKQRVAIATLSKSMNVTQSAIYGWIKKAREQGIKSLKSRQGTGRPTIITDKQLEGLVSCLRSSATRYGYSTDLWSGPRVRNLIKRKFGIEYHHKHMSRLLRRLGMVLKFPERRALEQDPQELREWKKYRFPEILNFGKKNKALIFFADECLISLIPYIGKTWTQKRSKPIARVSGIKHQHIGVTAAINAQSRFTFELTRNKENFNTHIFLRFVRKLHREHSNRFIVLIVDGATPHTSKLTKQFVLENKKWLRLEYLPAYSPELNPSEKPWGYVKTKKLNANQARSKAELREKVKDAFRRLKNDKYTLASFFT